MTQASTHHQPPTAFMPDGRPAPWLMTEDELIRFLRIDESAVRFPKNSIERLRAKYPHIIQPVKIGNPVRYKLTDVLRLIDQMQEDDPR